MRLATVNGDRELRFAEFGTSAVPPPLARTGGTLALTVTQQQAVGIPAVIACIRLVSETIAAMPLKVYRGSDRELAADSDQYRLLHDSPNADQSGFDFVCDVAASIEGFGNAYIHKVRSRRRIVELRCIPAPNVAVHQDRQTGELTYDLRLPQGMLKGLTRSDVLHIRGFTSNGKPVAPSPIEQHRDTLSSNVSMTRFQNAFFQNDARPGVVLKMPNNLTREQAKEMADLWDESHAGSGAAHRTAVIGGGADLVQLPVSLADAEFVASQQFSMEQIARIFNIPAAIISVNEQLRPGSAENLADHFLKFHLAPRLRRIEQAFRQDPQLFGTADADLRLEFLADAILRPTTRDRYEAYLKGRQAGWLTANQIRELENMPPLDQPGADELQTTPVGGAPNLQPDTPNA